MGTGPGRSPGEDDGADPPAPDRQTTPVYQRGRSIVELKKQAPRTSRDLLHSILVDGFFHSLHELTNQKNFQAGECFVALGQLVEAGYEFVRKSNSLQMRKRSYSDAPQDLLSLLAGIDGREPENVNPRHAYERQRAQISYEQGLGPKPDESGQLSYEAGYETGASGHQDEMPPDDDVASDVVEAPAPDDSLQISADGALVLPARFSVTATRAILAKKGSGKTYMAMVIAEEFLYFSKPMPFVVIDPTGVWYGLSSLANGEPSPNPVMILGGENGDLPITPEKGAAVAKIVMNKWPCPVVIDVSDMLPEDQHLFVADFGAELYAKNRAPVHIFLDEADEYVPQQMDSTYRHQRKCFHVIDRLVRRGRNRGIGITVITQRPAVLHKNVLTQVDGLVVLKMVAPHDIDAVESWMKPLMSSEDRSSCLKSLPNLSIGEGFFMQGGSKVVPCVRFITRPKFTYDSSRTPSIDEPLLATPMLGHVSLEILKYASSVLEVPFGGPDDDAESR